MNQKELFWISVTIFLTILAWMFVDIYRATNTTKVDTGLSSFQSVDFTIKTDVVNLLKQKTP